MDAEKQSRSTRAARTAYDTISQFRLDLILNELQESELNEVMDRLREYLVRLWRKILIISLTVITTVQSGQNVVTGKMSRI